MTPLQQIPKLLVAVVVMDYMMDVKMHNESRIELSDIGEARFLKELISALGFDYELHFPKDGEYGRLMSNGSWTGLVGMLHRNEVDLVCSGLMMTERRARVVDFTTSYMGTPLTFAIGKAGELHSKTAFLDVFDIMVWGCFFCVLIAVATAFRLEGKYSFGKILFELGGSVLRQPVSILDGNLRKLIRVMWMVYALVISACYCSALLSVLTVPNSKKNVETFRELANAVQRGTHRCYVQRGTNTASYLIDTESEHLQVLGRAIEKNDWYYETTEIGKHKTFKYDSAEITYENELMFYYGTQPAEVFISSDTIAAVPIAIALNKKFCCRGKLNKLISSFTQAGLVEKYIGDASFLHWLASTQKSKTRVDKERQLTLEDIYGALFLLFVGYVISFVFFLVEVVTFKYKTFKKYLTKYLNDVRMTMISINDE